MASKVIASLNNNVMLDALNLYISIFKLLINYSSSNSQGMYFLKDYDIPKNMLPFYANTNVPQILIQSYNNTNFKTYALDALTYFLGASRCSWKQIGSDNVLLVVNFLTESLITFLESKITDEACFISLSRLIYKLGKIIPLVPFYNNPELFSSFFSSVKNSSLIAFKSLLFLPIPPAYFLKFWASLAFNIEFRNHNILSLFELFEEIFREYIQSLLNSILPQTTIDFFTEHFPDFYQFVEDCKPLWSLTKYCMKPAAEFITSIFNQLLSELISNPAAQFSSALIYKLSLLILIFTSKLNGGLSISYAFPDLPIQLTILINSVFGLIKQTDPILNDLVNIHGHVFVLLERSLICFASKFKRDFLGSSSNHALQIYANLNVTQQESFDIFFNRFLNDLTLLIPVPDNLIEFLKFIDTLTSSNKTKKFANSNKLLQMLISHQIHLEFDKIDNIESVFQLYPCLNKLYSKAILTTSQMNTFLSTFDQHFYNAGLNKFRDPKEILIIYRGLNGVLEGTSAINLYLIVFKWFLKNHIEKTIQCLELHSKELLVFKSIAKFWKTLVVDKGIKLMLPSYSADGIAFIKYSLIFVNALMHNVPDSDIKMIYIIKILCGSITSRYSNFGIMKFYNDRTFEEMVDMLLKIIQVCPFHLYSHYDNMILLISDTISSLIKLIPEAIMNETYFPSVCNFYLHSFIFLPRSFRSQYAGINQWSQFTVSFHELITYLVQKNIDNQSIWECFRPHIVILLDIFLSTDLPIILDILNPFYTICKSNEQYIGLIIELICNNYDEMFRNEISAAFQSTFQILKEAPTKKTKNKFKTSLSSMREFLCKYEIQLATIPEFVNLFTIDS